MSDQLDREKEICLAKLAEQAERYDEMVSSMKKVVEMGIALNSVERNLLSVAYKNVIGARRASWRIVSGLEGKNDKKNEYITTYKKKIEAEMTSIIADVLQLLKAHLLHEEDDESHDFSERKVFYHKMAGDYWRYQAEFDENKEEPSEESLKAYEKAMELAAKSLKSTNPIRLGLSLNFSVFHYEIKNCPEDACKTAKESFDNAIAELDHLSEDSYKDSTLIMQLLRDNLTLWTSEQTDPKSTEEEQNS